jgi:hypothetical protein
VEEQMETNRVTTVLKKIRDYIPSIPSDKIFKSPLLAEYVFNFNGKLTISVSKKQAGQSATFYVYIYKTYPIDAQTIFSASYNPFVAKPDNINFTATSDDGDQEAVIIREIFSRIDEKVNGKDGIFDKILSD